MKKLVILVGKKYEGFKLIKDYRGDYDVMDLTDRSTAYNHDYYREYNPIDSLNYSGVLKNDAELENKKLYDIVFFICDGDRELNPNDFENKLDRYCIYTPYTKGIRFYRPTTSDIWTDETEDGNVFSKRHITINPKFWYCNSLTFNIISNLSSRIMDINNELKFSNFLISRNIEYRV